MSHIFVTVLVVSSGGVLFSGSSSTMPNFCRQLTTDDILFKPFPFVLVDINRVLLYSLLNTTLCIPF